jgi:hypothetical protein
MSLYPENPFIGQRLQSNANNVSIYNVETGHLVIPALDALVSDPVGVLAATALTGIAQTITSGITSPVYPKNISITGNLSGITGNVVIHGTNFKDEAISETVALNGTASVLGNSAFKTVTSVVLPVKVHTGGKQTETLQVTHACTSGGNITMHVTSTALGIASPKDVVVAVATSDTVNQVAAKIVVALNLDADVSAHFIASSVTDTITLTATTDLANDATLTLTFTDTDTTSVTVGSSTNGTSGVVDDKVTVGFGEKLGLPYTLSRNTITDTYLNNVKEGTAPTITISASLIESNTIKLNSTLNGSRVDVYLNVDAQ